MVSNHRRPCQTGPGQPWPGPTPTASRPDAAEPSRSSRWSPTRSELAKRWNDLIDLDAGPIATGEKTIEQVGWELFQLMLDVASGRKQVWADYWGLHNDLTLFNPAPVT